jgi:hypothetical protein
MPTFANNEALSSVRQKINAAIEDVEWGRGGFTTVADLLNNSTLTNDGTLEGQIFTAGGFRYRRAASTATDHHVTTAGGVKLYALSGEPAAVGALLDGVTNDAAALQKALDVRGSLLAADVATASISSGLTIPATARSVALGNITIRQPNGANIAKMVSHLGYGNNFGETRLRLDGNRDNNTAVVGFQIDGTAAGDRILFDISGVNCDTLVKCVREVEHIKAIVSGRACGAVVEVDTTTNTNDENMWEVYGYQVDTLFRSTGTDKSSGKVTVMAEIVYSWAIDLGNGWYSLDGIVRGAGNQSGGGVRITSTSPGRVYFGGLQLYGQTPAPNNGTWGLLCDSASTWLEGVLILGVFDGGAWIQTCNVGSNLRINMSSGAANGDGIRFGDAANSKIVNGCTFDIVAQGSGTGFYGANLDNVRNSIIRIEGEVIGSAGAVVISNDSFDNVIEIGRRAATNRTIVNNRTALDNIILYRGSYTQADLASVNGGTYFGGMQIEELIVGGGVRGPAYYDTARTAWLPVGNSMQVVTAASIAAVGNSINTTAKFAGKRVWDTTNNREMRARGPLAADPWDVIDGSASVTPA